MSYVLSVIHPPVTPAAFGKALVSAPRPSQLFAAQLATHQLTLEGVPHDEASRFAARICSDSEQLGRLITHEPSGLAFRIDPADNAPHPCPCGEGEENSCGRLVLPGDHAYAHDPDAYCLGCYTWDRNIPQCQPALTAHTEES